MARPGSNPENPLQVLHNINFNWHTLICRLKQTCKLSADGKKAPRAFLTGLFRGAYIWI